MRQRAGAFQPAFAQVNFAQVAGMQIVRFGALAMAVEFVGLAVPQVLVQRVNGLAKLRALGHHSSPRRAGRVICYYKKCGYIFSALVR